MGKRLEDLTLVDRPQAERTPVAASPRPMSTPADAVATPSTPVLLPKSIANLLPPGGFLREYVEYAYPLTEAPAESHLAAALVTASALVARSVSIFPWVGDSRLHLNIWVALLGGSTLPRKSTTVGISETVIRDVQPDLRLPDDTTAAALVDQLAACSERVWFLSELSTLFAQCDAQVNVGMSQLIAVLFDVPEVWESARRGRAKKASKQVTRIARPYVALLGATTTSWLTSHLNETDLLGGLHARFLYFPILDPGPNGRLFPIPPSADAAHYQRLLEQARRLHDYTGTVSLDRIRTPYSAWYCDHRRALYTLDDRERLGSFWGRLETYCLKLAALYQLSLTTVDSGIPATDHVFVIEPEALDLAIALVEFLKRALVRFVRQKLAPNAREAAHQRLLEHVRHAGGRIQRRILQQKVGLSSKDFGAVLQSLTEDGRLEVTPEPTEAGQTAVWVRLLEEEADA